MNLAVRRFLLFFFSIATLASCEDPNEIGLDLQDENQIGTDYTELSVNSGTVLLPDSILSFGLTPAHVGQIVDPVLGSVKATTFTEVGLEGTDVKFGDNPVGQSLELTLDYSKIYGDKTQPLTIKVYRLAQAFDEKVSYFTNSSLEYQPTPLGTATITPLLYEKKKEFDVDSTTAQNLIKITFPQEVMNEIIAQSGQTNLKTQANFESFFKGLAIIADGDPRSMLALNLNADSTKLVLRYTNGPDKKKHTFRLRPGSNVSVFTKFEGNRAGKDVEALNEKGDFIAASETGNESYIQNNTQLVTKLTLPSLQDFKNAVGTVIVNRAELLIPVKKNSTSSFTPPAQLLLYETNNANLILKDENGKAKIVQQNGALNSTAFPAPLIYDGKRDRYSLNITSYFQAMLLDKKPNNGFLLAPAIVSALQNGGYAVSTDIKPLRAIISNTEENPIQLVVYYSKLK